MNIKYPNGFNLNRYFCTLISGNIDNSDAKKFNRINSLLAEGGVLPATASDLSFLVKSNLWIKSKTLIDRIDLHTIFSVHNYLMPDINLGFRTNPSWAWLVKDQLKHYFTDPEIIHSKMNDLLSTINPFSSVDEALEFYCNILSIHPFEDGNGRVARIILEKSLEENGIIVVHPYYFFILNSHEMNKEMQLNKFCFASKEKMHLALEWSINVSHSISRTLCDVDDQIRNKVSSFEFHEENMILSYFWKHPAITVQKLSQITKLSANYLEKPLNTLVKRGVLFVKTMPHNGVKFLIQKNIYNCLIELDRLILRKKNDV